MSEYTKGPWRVWEMKGGVWCICEPNKSTRHSHFAEVRVGNMWGEEGKANARLMAAAPDLLEALEMMLEFPNTGPATDAAKKAIAKAIGAA